MAYNGPTKHYAADDSVRSGGKYARRDYGADVVSLPVKTGDVWDIDMNPGDGSEFRATSPDGTTGYEVFVDGDDVCVEISDFLSVDPDTQDYPKFTAVLAGDAHRLAAAEYSRGNFIFADEETAQAFGRTPADHITKIDDLARASAKNHSLATV